MRMVVCERTTYLPANDHPTTGCTPTIANLDKIVLYIRLRLGMSETPPDTSRLGSTRRSDRNRMPARKVLEDCFSISATSH